jgi:hypothetical protein
MYNKTFIQALIDADADLFDLDDYVDYWHEHETDMTLREFLGLTPYEYQQWGINDDSIFRDILRCRIENIDFSEYIRMDDEKRKVARSYDEEAIEKLRNDTDE